MLVPDQYNDPWWLITIVKKNSLLHTTTTTRIRHSSSIVTNSIAKRNMGIFFWSLDIDTFPITHLMNIFLISNLFCKIESTIRFDTPWPRLFHTILFFGQLISCRGPHWSFWKYSLLPGILNNAYLLLMYCHI